MGHNKNQIKDYRDLKIIVIGCGSIGQRHLRNLIYLGCRNLSGYDINSVRLADVARRFVIKPVTDYLVEDYDVALICTPHPIHIPHAIQLAEKGTDLFIEKPLSCNLKGVEKLKKLVKREKLISMVGCNYRFEPGIKMIKDMLNKGKLKKILSARADFGYYLPDWHPGADYTEEYSANKNMGGGVILDRIHEIDYLYWFFGAPQTCVSMYAKKSDLKIDTEDTAAILMSFKDGPIITVHLDYIQPIYHCSLKMVSEEGTLIWEFHNKRLEYYKKERKEVLWSDNNYHPNDMYVSEIKYFLECVVKKKDTFCNIVEGERILKIALEVKNSNIVYSQTKATKKYR